MIKTLKTTLLFAAAGSIGLVGPASAAVLNAGDQISFGINAFQVNAAALPPISTTPGPNVPLSPPFFPVGLSYPSAGGSAPDGGADGAFDAIFGTYTNLQPSNVTGLSPGTRVSTSCFASSDPTVPTPAGGFCTVGNYGEVQAGTGSGGFTLTPNGTLGRVANFDFPSLPAIGDNFLRIAANPGFEFRFNLTTPLSVAYLPVTTPQFGINFNDTTNIQGRLLFSGQGTVQYFNTATNTVVETVPFFVDFTGQGIRDDGTGGDPVASDGISARSTQSITFTVLPVPVSVPEPSTVGLLASAVFMGLGGKFLKKK
jgi:hypothetical protein